MKQSYNFLRASRSIAKTGFLWFKRRSEKEVEESIENVTPRGPQMDPKSRPKSIESVSWGAPKMDVKKVPSPGPGKVRSGYYL